MKKTIKIILYSILFIVLIFGFFIIITIHPELIIKNKIQHNNYNVYSTQPIDKNMLSILDSIDKIVSKCEIYKPNLNHRLFFYNGNIFLKFIHGKLFKAPTSNLMYNHGNTKIQNISTFYPVNIKDNLILLDKNKKINLTQTLAHEIIHTFQRKVHGNMRNYPFWKKEGYVEFWSDLDKENTTLDLLSSKIKALIQQDLSWMKDQKGNWIPFDSIDYKQISKTSKFRDKYGDWHALYYVSNLMVQFVFDVKSLDYNAFMSTDTKQNDILNEMFSWSENYSKL